MEEYIMRTRNLISAILGILTSIGAIVISIIALIAGFGVGLGSALGSGLAGTGNAQNQIFINIIAIFSFVMMGASVVGLVGSIICIFKAKVGGIIQLISAVLSLGVPLTFVFAKILDISIIIFFLPFTMYLTCGLLALLMKPKNVVDPSISRVSSLEKPQVQDSVPQPQTQIVPQDTNDEE